MDFEEFMVVGIIFLGCGLLFGIMMTYTGNNEVVKVNVLDDTCKALYGQNYSWVDSEVGVEKSLVCEFVEDLSEEQLNGFEIYRKE